jgi:hypothetical protein
MNHISCKHFFCGSVENLRKHSKNNCNSGLVSYKRFKITSVGRFAVHC